MSLIRLLVLAGVVLALVPADREARDAFFARVNEQVSWALSACERNPDSCDRAQQASREILARLQHGAAIVLHHAWLSFSGGESAPAKMDMPAINEASGDQRPAKADRPHPNKLSQADLRIGWSAPQNDRPAADSLTE